MNSRTVILIIGGVLISTICLLTMVFIYRLIFVNPYAEEKNPSLEVELVSAPETIDSICQEVSFIINVRNTGEADFSYSMFTKEQVQIAVITQTGGVIILQSKTGGTTFNNLTIQDFGSIAPGEEKQITVIADESTAAFKNNGFNNLQSQGNGAVNLKIRFEKYNGGASYTVISNEMTYSPTVNAFVLVGSDWTNKICN